MKGQTHLRATPDTWSLPKTFSVKTFIILAVVFLSLGYTGDRLGMGRAAVETGKGLAASVGLVEDSQVARGLSGVFGQMWPPVIETREDVSRISGHQSHDLPFLSRVEHEDIREDIINPQTLQIEQKVSQREVLVKPFGYLWLVCVKLFETIEIAIWGTLLAIIIGFPLALLGASNLTPHPAIRFVSRSFVSLLRAVPELISALFLVLAYGFGPIAGVLALAFHSAGFLGKFFAEDIENADPSPQEALLAGGAGRLKMFRFAILPQVLPQYVAYTLYILDRNVRMATVIGLVGAGGIGQELKGRYDMYDYGHVATVLIAIFVLVVALDQLAGILRKRLMS